VEVPDVSILELKLLAQVANEVDGHLEHLQINGHHVPLARLEEQGDLEASGYVSSHGQLASCDRVHSEFAPSLCCCGGELRGFLLDGDVGSLQLLEFLLDCLFVIVVCHSMR